jgi:hypothetical protein
MLVGAERSTYGKEREGMNAKHGYAGAVLLVLLAGPLVQAQAPNFPPFNPAATIAAPADQPPTGLPPTGRPLASPISGAEQMTPEPSTARPVVTPSLTDPALPANVPPYGPLWVDHPGTSPINCCGPTGEHGPISAEIYAQTGPSFLLSDSAFARSLHTGYGLGLVGRSLFYNTSATQDWNILLDLNYTYNDGIPTNTFDFNGMPVTIRNLDRTTVGMGLGYDWFLLGSGYTGTATGTNLRVGIDGGARWGTAHIDMNVVGIEDGYARQQHIYGEGFAGARFDLEVPMCGWTFISGLRSEYSYSSLHMLPEHQNTGLHNLNLQLTVGVRY